jgi:hypothetical protein
MWMPFLLSPAYFELVDDEVYLLGEHVLDEVDRVVTDEVKGLLLLYEVLEFTAIHGAFGFHPLVASIVFV